MTTNMRTRFEKGSATYICQNCGKLTRAVGDERGSCLCVHCYELEQWENKLADDGPDGIPAEILAELGYEGDAPDTTTPDNVSGRVMGEQISKMTLDECQAFFRAWAD